MPLGAGRPAVKQKHVVIIGAGFADFNAARELAAIAAPPRSW
jgi:NADH dehydrogenase FAD-containing subunit